MKYPYDNEDDGFLMKVNDVGIPVWFSTFSLSRESNDKITAMTKLGDYIYAFLTSNDFEDSAYYIDQLYR
jgi:hypothetical protein